MGRNLYKFTISFDDIIKMRQLKKVEGFQGFGLNVSKKSSSDFHQTSVILYRSF